MDAPLKALHPHSDRKEAITCLRIPEDQPPPDGLPRAPAHGLCDSSGAVEAGCTLAIGYPTETGRDALDPRGRQRHDALRRFKLTGRYDDSSQRRAVG